MYAINDIRNALAKHDEPVKRAAGNFLFLLFFYSGLGQSLVEPRCYAAQAPLEHCL